MAAGWIIKRNDKENGPFSPQQLKQLASSGKLKPEHLIRKEPGGKFQPAKSIKGLFPEPTSEKAVSSSDSAEFANIDISRYGDVPMSEEDEASEDKKKRKRKKSASKSGKGKKAKSSWLGRLFGGKK